MKPLLSIRNTEQGAFLLEALIGILIFSFGILGIVGLQAQAIRMTNDSEYRIEAVYLANSLISQMWADDVSTLKAKYDSTVVGPEYLNFKAKVVASLKGAAVPDPEVEVDTADLPAKASKRSSVVRVTIFWQLPGEPAVPPDDPLMHKYRTTGVVGQN